MTVKYTEEQMALIKDALNNARQLGVAATHYATEPNSKPQMVVTIHGIKRRLDKLAEIIDNGIVEETE
jgi:hypothetical protein